MKCSIPFEREPGDYVRISLFGLNYNGRVARCIYDGADDAIYEVQYADDKGTLLRGEFDADELETAPPSAQ